MATNLDDLRKELARMAAACEGATDFSVLLAARQCITPNWHAMPTVEEVKARDKRPWIVRRYDDVGIERFTTMIVRGEEVVANYYSSDNSRWGCAPGDITSECWPCDENGVREPCWVSV